MWPSRFVQTLLSGGTSHYYDTPSSDLCLDFLEHYFRNHAGLIIGSDTSQNISDLQEALLISSGNLPRTMLHIFCKSTSTKQLWVLQVLPVSSWGRFKAFIILLEFCQAKTSQLLLADCHPPELHSTTPNGNCPFFNIRKV